MMLIKHKLSDFKIGNLYMTIENLTCSLWNKRNDASSTHLCVCEKGQALLLVDVKYLNTDMIYLIFLFGQELVYVKVFLSLNPESMGNCVYIPIEESKKV